MLRALLPAMLAFSLGLLPAAPCRADQPRDYSVKLSVSRENPDASVGTHAGTEPLPIWVFVTGDRLRGGEFGLSLSGAVFVGFAPDTSHPWVTLPMSDPYPGTIAQVTAGDECYGTPLCFGQLTVVPTMDGASIIVDVIPSERARDVTIVDCDYKPTTVVEAHPVLVNGGTAPLPSHRLQRPEGGPPRPGEDGAPPAPPAPSGDR